MKCGMTIVFAIFGKNERRTTMKLFTTGFVGLLVGEVLFTAVALSSEVRIISEPVLTARVNQLYVYDVDAISDDPGDEIEYELRESPSGMTIDEVTGLIQWIPDHVGAFEVEIRAQGESSGSGSGHDDQEYTLTVLVGEPASLSGLVANEAGTGVPDVRLRLFEISAGQFVFRTDSDSTGHYEFSVINPGSYFLRVVPPEESGFARQWYDRADRIQDATEIVIPENTAITIDVTLLPRDTVEARFNVSGNVSSIEGTPLVGAAVQAFRVRRSDDLDLSGVNFRGLDDDDRTEHMDTTAITDSLGNYTLRLRARTYILSASLEGFVTQFWDHKSNSLEADRLEVLSDVSGIDFELAPVQTSAGAIQGTIRAASTGSPVQSHVLGFHQSNPDSGFTGFVSHDITDTLGMYLLGDLMEGYYIVLAVPHDQFLPTFYSVTGGTMNIDEASPVTVTHGLVDGIDINVLPDTVDGMNRVLGSVTTATAPLPGVLVFSVFEQGGEVSGAGVTNQFGEYALVGLAPGTHTVVATKAGFSATSSAQVALAYVQDMPATETVNLEMNPILLSSAESAEQPSGFALKQNYPNPFNPSTTIEFSVPVAGDVTVAVYNLLGQRVATLLNRTLERGTYRIEWDASRENAGASRSEAASGVYFYRVEYDGMLKVGRMILSR